MERLRKTKRERERKGEKERERGGEKEREILRKTDGKIKKDGERERGRERERERERERMIVKAVFNLQFVFEKQTRNVVCQVY